MSTPELHTPTHPVRFVTASALFDGHDASINIMRRIMQSQGAEVIHLGHNRSVQEVVDAAIDEDVQGVAVSSYQGGHVEYFEYLTQLLREQGAGHVKVFGGGGGARQPRSRVQPGNDALLRTSITLEEARRIYAEPKRRGRAAARLRLRAARARRWWRLRAGSGSLRPGAGGMGAVVTTAAGRGSGSSGRANQAPMPSAIQTGSQGSKPARITTGARVTREAALAKLVATDNAMRVTTDAVQVLGGAGYTKDFPVERFMREAKVTQIFEGTNQIQRMVIARDMLKSLG